MKINIKKVKNKRLITSYSKVKKKKMEKTVRTRDLELWPSSGSWTRK